MEEFSKEQLDAIKIVDKLYALRTDCEKASDYFRSKTKGSGTTIICRMKGSEETDSLRMQNSIPDMFCRLISMIDKGELVFKED